MLDVQPSAAEQANHDLPNEGLCAFNLPPELGQGSLRTLLIDDAVWFVAADVCTALSIGNTSDALRRLDDDEQALVSIEGISRGNDKVNVINESGLYSLILGSRKPEARNFKKWITSEVLPTIARTGSYSDDEGQMSEHLGRATADKLRLDAPAPAAAATPNALGAVLAMLLPLLLPLLPGLLTAVTAWLNRQATPAAKLLPDYMAESWFIILQAVCTEHPRVDVARRLGVSAPFLSQVLNGSGKYGRGEASTHKLAERTLRCFANLNPATRGPNRPANSTGKTTVTVEH